MFYADRNVRPCTILGYTLTTFPNSLIQTENNKKNLHRIASSKRRTLHKPRTTIAAKNLTTRPRQHPRSLNNEIVSRQMIDEINVEQEKSDMLTVAKLNTLKQFNKQDHKSKLMTEKYSLLPLNPQQLTRVQTAIQRMSE